MQQANNYKWMQKDQFVQLTVQVPPATKKTDCDIRFGKTYLYVGITGALPIVEVRYPLSPASATIKVSNIYNLANAI